MNLNEVSVLINDKMYRSLHVPMGLVLEKALSDQAITKNLIERSTLRSAKLLRDTPKGDHLKGMGSVDNSQRTKKVDVLYMHAIPKV
jgi:hypothetical protein